MTEFKLFIFLFNNRAVVSNQAGADCICRCILVSIMADSDSQTDGCPPPLVNASSSETECAATPSESESDSDSDCDVIKRLVEMMKKNLCGATKDATNPVPPKIPQNSTKDANVGNSGDANVGNTGDANRVTGATKDDTSPTTGVTSEVQAVQGKSNVTQAEAN